MSYYSSAKKILDIENSLETHFVGLLYIVKRILCLDSSNFGNKKKWDNF